MAGFKNIVVWITAKLNPASAKAVTNQMQAAINQGTNPAAAVANVGTITSSVNGLTTSLQRAGTLFLTYFGGRAIYRFISESVMMFARFDQKLQQSIAIMEGVDRTMREKLGATAIELSKELNMSAEDLAGAYYFLASAGLNAEQSLKGLPIVALFAKAGMMDLAEATELLTQANSVLGYQSKDASKNLAGMVRIADALTKAANESQATISQLSVSLATKAGNSLKLFGKDVEEGAAVLSVFANQGIRGAVAGERLDMFLRQATQAAIKHRKEFAAYGIQIFDAKGQMRNMADIADDLTKALGHLSAEGQVTALTQLGFQVRTVAAAKAFIGQGDAIRGYEKALRSASGYTKDTAVKQLDTPIEKWGLFAKKIAEVRMEIGEKFVDALTEAGQMLGDEDDPDSIIGMLKSFAKWLGENKGMVNGVAKAVVWLATKPLMFLFDTFDLFGDLLVVTINPAILAVTTAMQVLGMAILAVLAPLGILIDWASGGYFHEIKDLAVSIGEILMDVNKGNIGRGDATAEAFKRIIGVGDGTDPQGNGHGTNRSWGPKPKLIDGLNSKGAGRDGKQGEDPALDLGDPDGKKADKLRKLNERLDAMLAQHTKARADDNLVMLKKLEDDYKAYYGNKLPAAVADGFAKIKQAIQEEDDVAFFAAQLDFYKDAGASSEVVDDLITRLTNMRDMVDQGSVAWDKYNQMIQEANKLSLELKEQGLDQSLAAIKHAFEHGGLTGENFNNLKGFIKSITAQRDALDPASEGWKKYNAILLKANELLADQEDAWKDVVAESQAASDAEGLKQYEERMERIRRVGEEVADRLGQSWERFWTVLLVGSNRATDAFEQLGRGILAAMLGGIGEYASKKAQMDFALAAEETAKGFAALADPLLAATAPVHFIAAAKLAAVGALWATLGGAAGGIGGAVGNSSHGLGNSRESGSSRVDDSTSKGTEINIFIDGVDPDNPRHQQLIGDTVAEYQERTGGKISVKKGFKR